MQSAVIFWHRRDLRTEDNAGLSAALNEHLPVVPFFCFDRHILERLPPADRRVAFLHGEVQRLSAAYRDAGGDLIAAHELPLDALKSLCFRLASEGLKVQAIHTNQDYEPYAKVRDAEVQTWCDTEGIRFHTHHDHVVMSPSEVLKDDGNPYTVFTPYSRKWHRILEDSSKRQVLAFETDLKGRLAAIQGNVPGLEEMGFSTLGADDWNVFVRRSPNLDVIDHYAEQRDIPSLEGTTRMSLHLRFGTLSIRSLARLGLDRSPKWLTELIWRDFYQTILFHFPHSATASFRPKYDRIPWRHDESGFKAWQDGRTGYPLVDAGMRELEATGFMHNRVRMVVASFLCKHLLIDWRWGERHFAEKLFDFDLASNVGGWQWASGSGCDAAPYFRVFNPESQQKKFDPDFAYIRHWVPEYGTPAYPEPIVDHRMARLRAIDTYKKALAGE